MGAVVFTDYTYALLILLQSKNAQQSVDYLLF